MELLPPHLQDDKVAIATANPIVTGWVNPFKLKYNQFQYNKLLFFNSTISIFFLSVSHSRSKVDAIDSFRKNGFIESEETEDGEVPLKQCYFKFDKLCPLFVSCIPMDRSQFAKSVLMKEHQFIMQVDISMRLSFPPPP